MADAFKGLTIRLGADARPLNSAIASVRTSAAQAQKQLTAMNKALKFDKTNVAAMGARIDLMGDKATLAARSVRDIRTAMGQASEASRRLASSTQNVYAETHKVRSQYNHVNASLQTIYDDVRKIVAEEKGWAESSKKVDNYMKKLKNSFNENNKEAWKLRRELELYLTMAHSKYGTGDAYGLKQTFTDGKKLMSVLRNLRSQSSALGDKLEELKAVEGLSAMKIQLIAWEAEMRNAISETVRFRSELYSLNAAPGVAKSISLIERMDAAIDDAAASVKKMNQLFKAAPGDIEAAKAKLIAEAHQTEILADKIKEYKSILRSIEATGFDRSAASIQNVYKWVAKAKTACVEWEMKVESARAALEHLKQTKDDLEGVKNKTKENAARFAELEHRIENVTAALVKMDAKTDELNADLANANKARRYKQVDDDLKVATAAMTKATTKASALRRALDFAPTFRTMGYGLYSTLTPAIMIAGRYALQSARDIDAAYRDMRKTVNGTEEEFEHLRDAALEFSTTHFTSAEKILEIEAMGGQLGIAVSDLEAFSETVSNLDVATNIDADTAAEQLGKMATVLGIAVDDYDNFGDALVRLGNNMPVMESDILTLTTRFMGMGKVVGMQSDEMLAWAAAASATGQKAEAAGSAMQRFIAKMETAVVSGEENLEAWASVARMSGDEFKAAFEEDASKAMYKFIEGLAAVQTEGGSVNQILQELGINNVRDKQLLEGLAVQMANAAVSGNVLGDALDMANKAYHGFASTTKDGKIEEAGDAAREAAKKAEGFSGQIEMMIHDAQLLAQELAVGALPYIKALAQGFKSVTEVFKAMPDEMKSVIVGLLGITAALGPLMVGLGAVGSAVLTFTEVWEKAIGTKTLEKAAQSLGILGESTMTRFRRDFEGASKVMDGFAKRAGDVFKVIGKFGPMFAIAAAAVVYLTASIADSVAQHKAYTKLVDELNVGLAQINPSANGAASGLRLIGNEAKMTAASIEEIVKSGSEAVKAIEERNGAAASEVGSLNAARIAIEKYGNAGKNLTGAQQGELRAAIDLVNEKCGTQYQILDLLTGKLGDESGAYLANKDAIMENIAQRQKLVKVQALEADLATLQAEREKTLQALILTDSDSERTRLYKVLEGYDSALEATEQMLADAASAADDAKLSLGKVVEQTTEFQAYFKALHADMANNEIATPWKSGEEALLAFGEALDRTGLDVEDFSNLSYEQMATLTRTWMESGGDMEATLASIGLQSVTLEDQFKSACEGMEGGFESIVSQFETDSATLASALSEAGISAQQFASFSAEEIASAMEESGGTVEGFIAKLQEINQQHIEASITANDEASNVIEDVESEGEEYDNSEYEADYTADTEEAEEAYEDVTEAGEDYDGTTYSAKADLNTDPAYEALDSLKRTLNSFTSETYTAKVSVEKTGPDAAGGFYKLHASGGFITNGVTSLGTDRYGVKHIAGEAGREWVMRHADGTTSIVPIQNRRYLKPYANTIASMIGNTGPKYEINLTIPYNASDDVDEFARVMTRKLNAIMDMRG